VGENRKKRRGRIEEERLGGKRRGMRDSVGVGEREAGVWGESGGREGKDRERETGREGGSEKLRRPPE
jgi:hypothetical protein